MRSPSDVRCVAGLGLALLAPSGCGDRPADDLDGAQAQASAPTWLLDVQGHGTWIESEDVVDAWLDARVANVRFHKRVLIDVAAPYGDTWMRTLHVAGYRETMADGWERWGADTIEIYPTGGPNGAELTGDVVARVRFQHDLDGDGADEMLTTAWVSIHGDGDVAWPDDDVWSLDLESPVQAGDAETEPLLLWSPYDDPGMDVEARIDAITAAQLAAPDERHTLHAAVFNITDDGIVDRLIEAHAAGVEVLLLFDGRKFRPGCDWYTGDDRLLAAGVPLLGVVRADGAMHDKIALFDGGAVATGSFNWEWGARYENHELMVVTQHPDLLAAYARRFEALAGGVQRERAYAHHPADTVSVSFAPDEEPHRIVGELLDGAHTTINLAMFTAKDVVYEEDGVTTSLLTKLVEAHQRGVRVIAIIDHGIHEAAEYYGQITEDDQTDEWLESQGVTVIRADNPNGEYASMHHKHLTIDGEIAVFGAFNWYHDAAFHNDEDQVVWRDAQLATDLDAELVDLLRRYDPAFAPDAWPQTTLAFDAYCDQTRWGEQVYVVGDHDLLGAWDPRAGLPLDGSTWPHWLGELILPRGTRTELKLVITDNQGGVEWEAGDDIPVRAHGEHDVVDVPLSFR